jgi:hypothetical protein
MKPVYKNEVLRCVLSRWEHADDSERAEAVGLCNAHTPCTTVRSLANDDSLWIKTTRGVFMEAPFRDVQDTMVLVLSDTHLAVVDRTESGPHDCMINAPIEMWEYVTRPPPGAIRIAASRKIDWQRDATSRLVRHTWLLM